jgi:hypothetical protein
MWKCFVQNTVLMATQPLAQDWGLQAARNNFLWVKTAHWKPYKVLGTLRKSYKLPKGLADDSMLWITANNISMYSCGNAKPTRQIAVLNLC